VATKRAKSKIARVSIDHFRGIHQEISPDDYSYSRTVMGLIDEHGGMLSRIGGKISYGSNPMGSVWGLHQLRFKDNFGIVVHTGSSRHWYDHGVYVGPGDGMIDVSPEADADVQVFDSDPGDIGDMPPGKWTPSATCHSDIVVHQGINEFAATDLKVCYRSKANLWSGGANKESDVASALLTMWGLFETDYAGRAWSVWASRNACDAAIPAPYFQFYLFRDDNPEVAPFTPWHIILQYKEVQYSIRSNYLAGVTAPPAPPCGSYVRAAVSLAGIVADDLSDYIGNPDAALTVACGSGSMPIMTTTTCSSITLGAWVGKIAAAIAAAKASHWTYQYLYNDAPSRPTCTDILTLSTNRCGWFEHVTSHFEE